ncbi:GGDEF domain-containing protein [Mangrovicella endophytica]|uniref:GGDEF domain-containing protein n=1 Tax=Mangrovicella endophytica TaxID=2066697 RepID=UPI000C9DFDA3|nr:GGDEF domain-containing protein [Mangrovicella endophytica]
MQEAILYWSVPVTFWIFGSAFMVLRRRGFQLHDWGASFLLLGAGYASIILPPPQDWPLAKNLVEDMFFLSGTAVMNHALTRRFPVRRVLWPMVAIILASLGGAAWAVGIRESIRIETLIVQAGCALLILTTLAQLSRRLDRPVVRLQFTAFAIVCVTLLVQCGIYAMTPEPGGEPGDWLASGNGFIVQVTGVCIAVFLAFAIVLSIGMDAMEQLERVSITDPLSGLLNRRGFEKAAAERRSGGATVILLDIDHFKRVNDGHGHAGGDIVIAGVGRLLSESVLDSGLVARLGGEEFVILLPTADRADGYAVAETFRQALEIRVWPHLPGLRITGSFGVATLGPSDSIDEALRVADLRLYAAKASGRNRVVASDEPDERAVGAAWLSGSERSGISGHASGLPIDDRHPGRQTATNAAATAGLERDA